MDAASGVDGKRAGAAAWLAGCLAAGAGHRVARGPGHALLALVMMALGVRGLAFGDFAGTWQRIPIAHLPAHDVFVYLTALVELATGIGILIPRVAKVAAGAMSVFALLWMVLLKFPAILYAPAMEATWLGAAEIAVILTGAWAVFASLAKPDGRFLAGRNGIRNARLLLVLALPTIGLSHYFYADITAGFVPAWLPWRHGWAYLTGAGSLATALGILFALWPRLATTLEAAMLGVITLLVWLPPLLAHAHDSDAWSAFLMSSAITAGAAAVADSYRGIGWTARGPVA
ncbi:DoxX family protein [Rhodanobacter sp. DHG33]|uniref:DoxX family protein n=1 Tax=Rhodanobacter sp. DHG33 TaxID=2775921 RepID=UPI00177F63C4|nr:DoxX family protein [Rhodanobacter sp. DHG33]MBD8899961.1 DoxX family protein [Rhodanobacter sp. DHG33]